MARARGAHRYGDHCPGAEIRVQLGAAASVQLDPAGDLFPSVKLPEPALDHRIE
uniref:Uncharacterized protein n=1 Tax=Triticum urartu TaxID=4572 RepID=A0A8R7QQH5_TRIUA